MLLLAGLVRRRGKCYLAALRVPAEMAGDTLLPLTDKD